MVEERVTDGRRIAELLASEVEGRAGDLAALTVANADRDVEPTAEGARAYDVVHSPGATAEEGEVVATAFVQPERVRLEVATAPETAVESAAEYGLRARPRGSPATLVFVESGAETKRASDVLGAVATGADD